MGEPDTRPITFVIAVLNVALGGRLRLGRYLGCTGLGDGAALYKLVDYRYVYILR
jgi:hypothetical protein